MRTQRLSGRALCLLAAISAMFFFGCGYSQEEWDQKVREGENLRNQLAARQKAHDKCEADLSDALAEVDGLKTKLTERGLNIDNLSANLEQQRKALEEYRRRAEQLDLIRKRFEALRVKLQKLTNLGLKVQVRANRMLIELPGDVLFDSGQDRLKKEGQAILLEIAKVIREDTELAARDFQVAGHTDSMPLRGGQFRDNWGLSAMRARSVLQRLTAPVDEDGGGLSPQHWSAAGYGETDPVATNDTPEGRKSNRRVELVVQPNVEEMLNLDSLAN